MDGTVFFINQRKEYPRQEGVHGSPKALIDMAKGKKKHRKADNERIGKAGLFKSEGKVIAEVKFFQIAGT